MSYTKLSPSYYGYVGSTKDALLIIQAILSRQLELVPGRPRERERLDLIKSGNVFIFIEEHSGIKRWTDGISWSPSRILGRFLVYRELDKDSLSDDKKKGKKRKIAESEEEIPGQKSLLGSLVMNNSQHGFKDQGLIKKTLSITTTTKELNLLNKNEKQTIHLISYYNANDVLNGKLLRPSESDLKNLTINNYLWNAIKESTLGGKIPIEDEAYYFLDNNYQLQNMALLQQNQQHQHHQTQQQHLPPHLPQGPHSHPQHPRQPLFVPQKYSQPPSNIVAHPPPPPHHMLPIPSNYDYHKREDDDVQFVNPFNGANPGAGQQFQVSSNLNAFYHQNEAQSATQTPQPQYQQYYPFPQHFHQVSQGADFAINTGASKIPIKNQWTGYPVQNQDQQHNDSIHHHPLHNPITEENQSYIANYNS